MGKLSEDLASQFAKLTNDSKQDDEFASKESTVYGTVKSIVTENNKKIYNVEFDGCEGNATPVRVTSVNVSVNDRVVVSMKNREPVITSNLTKPTINIDYLEAGSAKFKGVVTQKVQYNPGQSAPPYEDEIKFGDPTQPTPIRIKRTSLSTNCLCELSAYMLQFTYGSSVVSMNPSLINFISGSNNLQITPTYIEFTNGTGASGTFNINGYEHSSDLRLKKDICKLDPETAKRLKPVLFKYKNDSATHYGFIAQDVKECYPGAVGKNTNGYLTLSYTELIAPTLALAQENAKEIEALRQEIEQLKGELDEIKHHSVPAEEE